MFYTLPHVALGCVHWSSSWCICGRPVLWSSWDVVAEKCRVPHIAEAVLETMPGRSWQNMTLKWFLIQSSSAHPCKQTMLKRLYTNYCAPIWLLRLSLWHTAWPAITVLIRQCNAGSWCHGPRHRTKVWVMFMCNSDDWSRTQPVIEGKMDFHLLQEIKKWRLWGRLPVLRFRCRPRIHWGLQCRKGYGCRKRRVYLRQ